MTRPLKTTLALKWLWLRHSCTFRWAHKPLCSRFERDVIKLGRLHLCRSCCCVYTGAILSLILGLIVQPFNSAYWPYVYGAIGIITLILSYPHIYRHWSRFMRDMLRFTTGILIGGSIALACLGIWLPVLIGVILGILLWRVFLRARSQHRKDACHNCPHLKPGHICPGFQHQAMHARSYESAASTWVLKSGYHPVRD